MPKEHLECLTGVFEKLAQMRLKLKPKKCEFLKTKLAYLGHIVSKEGIETNPIKIEAIRDWPRPCTVTNVRSFLGFTNHYRRFLKGYAQIAHPLNKLTSGVYSNKKNHPIDWDNVSEESFIKLKELCTSTPVLACADYSKPFKLHPDTSGLGLGAVLYQTHEDDRVIAYASRVLNHTEVKYPAHKLEFLALKWAVTDRSHEYLYYGKFNVYTENNPLTYILTTTKLDATGQ